MRVWRVETPKGNGPYRGDRDISEECKEALRDTTNIRHPMPYDDIWKWDPIIHKEWLFGFSSIQQLKLWFNYVKDFAHEFLIVEYEAKHWLEGNTQLVFFPLEIISKRSLKEIYEM